MDISSYSIKALRAIIQERGGWTVLGVKASSYKTKKALVDLVIERGLMEPALTFNKHEELLKAENPTIYELAKPVMSSVPDLRIDIPETVHFRKELGEWDPWKCLRYEIEAFSILQQKEPTIGELFSVLQQKRVLTPWYIRNLKEELQRFADAFPLLLYLLAFSNQNVRVLLVMHRIYWPFQTIPGSYTFTKVQKSVIYGNISTVEDLIWYENHLGDVPADITVGDLMKSPKSSLPRSTAKDRRDSRAKLAIILKNMLRENAHIPQTLFVNHYDLDLFFRAVGLLLRDGGLTEGTVRHVVSHDFYALLSKEKYPSLMFRGDDFMLLVRAILKIDDTVFIRKALHPLSGHHNFKATVRNVLASYRWVSPSAISWASSLDQDISSGVIPKMLEKGHISRARAFLPKASLQDRLCFSIYTREELQNVMGEVRALPESHRSSVVNHTVISISVRYNIDLLSDLLEMNPNSTETSINLLFYPDIPVESLQALLDNGFYFSEPHTRNTSLLLSVVQEATFKLLLTANYDREEILYIVDHADTLNVSDRRITLLQQRLDGVTEFEDV